MEHLHFFFRNQPVELTASARSQIASSMSLTRVIHNHFVLKYQHTHFKELDQIDFSVESIEEYLGILGELENFEMLQYQSKETLKNIAVLISLTWEDAVARKKIPRFQKHRDEGYLLYASMDDFRIDADTLSVFGLEPIELPVASIKLAGEPTLVLFRRQKNEEYWVTILYERPRSFSQDYAPLEVQESGEEIRSFLQEAQITRAQLWRISGKSKGRANWPAEGKVSQLRLRVLKTITRTRSPVKTESEPKPHVSREYERNGVAESRYRFRTAA
jgi:hypothetical protein